MADRSQALARQFAIFAGMGALGTGAHYATLLVLVEWFGLSPAAGSASGFVVGALVNYALNYRFTFRSSAPHAAALPRSLTVAVIGFFMNSLFMAAGTRWTAVHYLFVQILATGAVLLWNFAASRLWAFREEGHAAER